MIDLQRVRAQTPGVTHRAHFNNCGAALMASPVIDALRAHLDLESRIGGYEAEEQVQDQIRACYLALARMLGCAERCIGVVENATRAWDMLFYALRFSSGDRILTSEAEYASNYIAFLQVAKRTGATVEAIPSDASGSLDVSALEDMLDDRVRLIAITHVPTGGGLVNPAAAVGRVARNAGVPYLLDACQSAGQMPLDVDELGVDFLTATSRKYLRGPRGVGFLYVREKWIEQLEPPFLDLLAADWVAPDRYRIRDDARRFETWEGFVAGRVGLGVAVNYALDLGLEAIRGRVYALADSMRRSIASLPHLTCRDTGAERCGIVTFTHERLSPDEIKLQLRDAGINVSTSTQLSTRLDYDRRNLDSVLRAGVHYYNSEGEVERLMRCLEDLR